MKKFRNFAINHPILFGILLLVLYPVLAFLTYPVRYLFPATEIGQIYSDTAAKLILFLLCLGVLWGFGWIRLSGITRFGSIKIWLWIILIFVYHVVVDLYVFTGEIGIVSSNSPLAMATLLYYLVAGLFEETLFRGLILLAMVRGWGDSKTGLLKAVMFSSMFFGLIHLFNLVELPIGAVVFQVAGAAMLGVLWSALLMYTGSLWPAIVLHWLTNAAVNIQLLGIQDFTATGAIYARLAIWFIPMALLGLYLLWKRPQARKSTEGFLASPA